jgi:putative ABC transport system permease protein
VGVIGVQRPAEVADAGTLRATPAYLALALAGAAVVALGLTLIASVRRRRRDLALLKALGFTQRQLAAAVAWQATVAAVIGLIIGVPVGAFIGRALWILFARSIYVVPEPTVPVLAVGFVVVGALIFANLVALVPGRSAARTSAALVLRAE